MRDISLYWNFEKSVELN